MSGLYAIVDVPHPHGLTAAEVTEAVLGDRLEGGRFGASMVQLRAKGADTRERRQLLSTMAPLCARGGARLVVDDDLDAVIDGVHGVHLGQADPGVDDVASVRHRAGRPLEVGLSTHDQAQLRAALRQRPDLVAFGPVRSTSSKDDPDPVVGLGGLTDACRMSGVPLVAIGGLDEASGCEAIEVGATWVAVISALVAPTPSETRARAVSLGRAFARAAQPRPLAEVAAMIPVIPAPQLFELARWSDSLGVHVELGLPARFRPWVAGDEAWYRPCDVVDLQFALGKLPGESWQNWMARAESGEISSGLVQLRTR